MEKEQGCGENIEDLKKMRVEEKIVEEREEENKTSTAGNEEELREDT